MSNKRKIKVSKNALQNSLVRSNVEGLWRSVERSLDQVCPGSRIEINSEVEGEFFVITPSQRLPLKSVVLLGSLLHYTPIVGEAALIHIVQRANGLISLVNDAINPIDEGSLVSIEAFMDNMIRGQAVHLGSILDRLNDLVESESAAFGMLMATATVKFIAPFGFTIVPNDDCTSLVKSGSDEHLLLSISIFLYVLRHVKIDEPQDVIKAVITANVITNPEMYFDEFKAFANRKNFCEY